MRAEIEQTTSDLSQEDKGSRPLSSEENILSAVFSRPCFVDLDILAVSSEEDICSDTVGVASVRKLDFMESFNYHL